ncbi:MAG: hypothetical protein JWN03_372 [Nocardia sp.]|uniref:hypothetical protein n=1 Tax=Nocardia sp. TaxID=1821 RepID=UPI0026249697|nr:hypothetical protein [Nocardia sp.]MCU1640097.1 hypothetical protein [Nocardia sp.]
MTTPSASATTMPIPRSALPAAQPGRSAWQRGSLWWDAKSVLVTRPTAPGRLVTVPHLVVPAEYGRLNFLLSSYDIEAEQLGQDRRVMIQPGDWRGRPMIGSRQQYGSVHIVRDDFLLERAHEGMRIKYGARNALARMAHRFKQGTAPYGDLVAFVEVHPHRPLMIEP